VARLDGKVAIVTGAATGLGREIARLYAAEARVSSSETSVPPKEGRRTAQIVEAGGRAMFVEADVAASSDMERLVEEAERHFWSGPM